MSHITKEHLAHLAKLARIQLSPEDEQILLPQLENIIGFVGQLQDVDLTGIEPEQTMSMPLATGVEESGLTEKILANVQHPVDNSSLQITGTLSEA